MAQKKYMSLERLQEYDALIKQDIAESLSTKADASHSHNDTYYTETEIDSKISTINASISNIANGTTTVKNAEHATNADSATSASNADKLGGQSPSYYAKASDIPTGSLANKNIVSESDLDSALAEKVNAASEGNHSHSNKSVLDGITSTKVSNWDSAEANAKAYADTAASNAATKVKNDLLNGAGTAYDTLKELGDLIDDNADAIEALETIASGKADASHGHAISEVSGLQSALDGKADASHGTHVTYSTTAPVMDGTASAGSASAVARSDHKHPTDTSRASKTEFETHASNTTVHITSTERTNWGTAYTHSQAAHAPSNAEKNQNAFSNVKVGSTTVAADTTTDTLTLVAGTNVQITADANADSVTISATDTVYTHPSSGVAVGTYKSVTVNAQGHVTAGSNPTTLSGYGITDAASKTHSHSISEVTNLQTTLNNASSAISANTQSIQGHTEAITALQNKVGDGFEEITSAEIQALFA